MKALDLRPGSKIEHKNDIWTVTERTHRTPGKGQAIVQVRLRSLTDGRNMNERFRSMEEVVEIRLDSRNMEYLYRDGDLLTFMDTEDYEQIAIAAENIGDAIKYLVEGMKVIALFREGTPIAIDIPTKVVLTVTETEPGVRGDTVSNVTKSAKLETGTTLQVPLFVEQGQKIRVNTETGEYVERANE